MPHLKFPSPQPFSKRVLLSSVGWSVYLSGATAYCLAYQIFVLYNSAIDLPASLRWAYVEWGAWWILTPTMFAVLDRASSRRHVSAVYYAAIAAAAVALSLAYRLGMDFGAYENSLPEKIVHFLPRYLTTSALVLFAWHVFLRKNASAEDTPNPPEGRPDVQAAPEIRNLLVSKGVDEYLLEIDQIDCFSAAGNYVEIMVGRDAYLLRSTLKQIEDSMPDSLFVRTHRSHIVSIRAIERIRVSSNGSGTVDLKGGHAVKLSKKHNALLKQRFALLHQV